MTSTNGALKPVGESTLKLSETVLDDLCWWTDTFGRGKKKVGDVASLAEHGSGPQFHQASDVES